MSGLAALIQSEISSKGWSLRDLAAEAGIPVSTLSNIMNKPELTPDLRTLAILSTAFKLPLRRLVEACGFPIEDPGAATDQDARAQALIRAVPEFRLYLEHLARLVPDDQESVLVFLESLLRRRGITVE